MRIGELSANKLRTVNMIAVVYMIRSQLNRALKINYQGIPFERPEDYSWPVNMETLQFHITGLK